jgi:RNB domain
VEQQQRADGAAIIKEGSTRTCCCRHNGNRSKSSGGGTMSRLFGIVQLLPFLWLPIAIVVTCTAAHAFQVSGCHSVSMDSPAAAAADISAGCSHRLRPRTMARSQATIGRRNPLCHHCTPFSKTELSAYYNGNNNNKRKNNSNNKMGVLLQEEEQDVDEHWYPKRVAFKDENDTDAITDELERRIVQMTANLVRHRLRRKKGYMIQLDEGEEDSIAAPILDEAYTELKTKEAQQLVQGRFMDLACRRLGEQALEDLFWQDRLCVHNLWREIDAAAHLDEDTDSILLGAVTVLQSLCVMATQVGVKGPPDQLRRNVAHLQQENVGDKENGSTKINGVKEKWNNESVRKLKYKLDRRPAMQLMVELGWKRTTQGAFDLLVELGAWEKHEDLALLRSGFPIRFTVEEEQAATEAIQLASETDTFDIDHALGLRQDLRHLKVYTIDSASTSEIDDGLSVETITGEGGQTRQRIWIHIADADHWAPRVSELFEAARRRITSLYLPRESISMFPSRIASYLMSLRANEDTYALSLGVELNEDGSVDSSSIVVTPSIVNVSYRLTYDDADDMLAEGVAYSEEWELGALFVAASKRRQYRVSNGSQEGTVPNPIPYSSVSVHADENAPDGIAISVNVEVSHNAAKNNTANAEDRDSGAVKPGDGDVEEPVSSSNLLVTEAMILAGEALGKWKGTLDEHSDDGVFQNNLRLPFRSQNRPGKCCERDMIRPISLLTVTCLRQSIKSFRF